jgi:hypothetical protein
MTTLVSTDAPTHTIPGVQAAVVPVTNARVATSSGRDAGAAAPALDTEVAVPDPDAQVVAPEHSTEIACEESVEYTYRTGLAKLEALHDRWAAAMAEIRQAPASGEPGEAAA